MTTLLQTGWPFETDPLSIRITVAFKALKNKQKTRKVMTYCHLIGFVPHISYSKHATPFWPSARGTGAERSDLGQDGKKEGKKKEAYDNFQNAKLAPFLI